MKRNMWVNGTSLNFNYVNFAETIRTDDEITISLLFGVIRIDAVRMYWNGQF